MMENMQEMVKFLLLIKRDLSRGREFDRYRNKYGTKPYWNPQKRPMNDYLRKPLWFRHHLIPTLSIGPENKKNKILTINPMKRMKNKTHQRILNS